MIIDKKYVLHKICNLTLPEFYPDESDKNTKSIAETQRMNEFYNKLREEMISYTEKEEKIKIRRYTAVFSIDSQNENEISVYITITARLNYEGGRIISMKKTLIQKWKNGLLYDFKEII